MVFDFVGKCYQMPEQMNYKLPAVKVLIHGGISNISENFS
jgi:hypothetical protein